MVLMVEQNHGEHLIPRFVGRGNEPDPHDVKIASLKQRIQELEFPQLQQDLPTEEAKTESNVWDDGSEDDIGDEEEGYPFVNKYPSFQEEPIVLVEEESCPEEGCVGKGGFGVEEDNKEDVVVVANDICSSMIQTILSVDFEEDINTKPHELISFGKMKVLDFGDKKTKVSMERMKNDFEKEVGLWKNLDHPNVTKNRGEHLIPRFVGRGNKPDPRDVKIASLKQRIQELEFSQLQQDLPAEEAKTESNVWDDRSEDVNPFGGGNPGFHDDHYDNLLLTKKTESEPII
ncbi:hypothetical protein Tco_0305136 [Tanacetum coccineum]